MAQLLRNRGFADADFERQFTITDPVSGKNVLRKPDVVFSDGGTHIISAKVGERREREAISTAINYLRDLAPVTNIGEVFAVTYPEGDENYHFHVLPMGRVEEVSLVFESLQEVAGAIAEVVRGRIKDILRRAEPAHAEAGRILRYTAQELATSLEKVPPADLEEIFGGHDFFDSALSASLTDAERREALRLGPAYLFVNQVLFYTLLSQAAQAEGRPELYPPIEGVDRGSPVVLRERYFDLVRQKDYEPIYGPDISRHLQRSRVGHSIEQLVDTLTRIAPKLTVPDLVGQVFQNLIPFAIRKPLGAYYTNPNAASLLSRLAITDSHETVLDPACGSGTLLVASYRAKWSLLSQSERAVPQSSHKVFVEKEITGIDAMAFSSHLAAVNLALQQPLLDTDYVRIARADSTGLVPGHTVSPVGQSLPGEFKQKTLLDVQGTPPKGGRRTRIPALRAGGSSSFTVTPVDTVIMNPPFTSQNNMSPEYRATLRQRFRTPAAFREIVFWKTSEQVYFLLFADRFLRPGGRIAAVLPLTTFTGHAFRPLVDYFVKNYTVEVVVAGLGRCSFSEDTSMTECLFVARKSPPSRQSAFTFVGLEASPSAWSERDVAETLEMIQSGVEAPRVGRLRRVVQEELLPDRSALSGLLLRLDPAFEKAWQAFEDVVKQSTLKLVQVKRLFERGLELTEVYHGDYRPLRMGPKALIACRDETRSIKETDRLIIDSATEEQYILRDRVDSGNRFVFPRTATTDCLRRFTGLPSINVTGKTDIIVSKVVPPLERAMKAFYKESDAKLFLKRLARTNWPGIITRGSARVNIVARADLAAPGTIHLVVRSDAPAFLAGAYGYNVKGFRSEREEKLFALWLNSSFSLVQLLAKATITRGSWVKLEQFTTEQVLMPDPAELSEAQWADVESLWAEVASREAPSLMQQLEGDRRRLELDSSLLRLIGVSRHDAAATAKTLASGSRAAIQMLLKTMG